MSKRQRWVAVFVALLAPAAALPTVLARTGGALGWLGPVAAIPAVVVLGVCLGRLGDGGLGAGLKRWGVWGKALTAVYYLWAAALAALTAGSAADRLGRTDYGGFPAPVLAVALGAVAAYLIIKGPAAFGRAAEVFFLVFAVVLAGVFLLGAGGLRAENLAPSGESGWDVLKCVWPVLGTVSVGAVGWLVPVAPPERGADGAEREDRRGAWRWLSGWCLAAAGCCLVVVGALGAPIAANGPLPFFLALQGLGLEGGFQRLEALGTAVWVLSDLCLIGLTALAGRQLAGAGWGAWPVLGSAVLGGMFLDNAALEPWMGWMYAANGVLGLAVPGAMALAAGGAKNRG